MTEPFSWKALQMQLRASCYICPGDDTTTQRGLIATAAAIIERMSLDVREVTWTPQRVLDQRARTAHVVIIGFDPGHETPAQDCDGGALVLNPVPPPNKPRGGLAASRQKEEALAW